MKTKIKTISQIILKQFALLMIPVVFAIAIAPIDIAHAETPNSITLFAQEECMGAECIENRIRQVARVLSAGLGVVIAIMAVTGGIQYITAGGNPQKISAAKGRIAQALIAMFLFIFGLSILNWLVPGTIST